MTVSRLAAPTRGKDVRRRYLSAEDVYLSKKEAGSVEEILKQIVEIIVEAADPDKIILFGSRATGDWSDDSDYDILVVKRGAYHRRKLAQELYRALFDVPAAIDIVVETPERLARYKCTPGLIYFEALKGRVLYER